jgi:RNA polymerase sigma factor (sigma-70 family)
MAETEKIVEGIPLEGDIALLHHYVQSQEPAAFVELSCRYAGVVYGTCLRITANVHDAEELTQECFFELARRAATIRSSVGGWLHSVATRRALNAVRSRNRRRNHEQGAATTHAAVSSDEGVAWRQLEPLLDRAIEDLPEELRTPIILHFLENRPQSEVAARLGVHQTTVSRRIQEALPALRARLRDSGFVMAVAPLASLLAAHAGQTAEPQLLASLGKIALAGVGSAAAGKAMSGVGAALVKLSTCGKAMGALALPIIAQFVLGGWWGFVWAIALLGYFAWRQPKWHEELLVAMGAKGYGYEFFPLMRWTWTTPPAGWRKAIFRSLMGSVMMAGVAIAVLIPQLNPMSLGWAAMMTVYGTVPLITAFRIWRRVRACPANTAEQPVSFPSPPDAIGVAQSIGTAIAVALSAASFALWLARNGYPRRWLFMLLILVVTACWAFGDAIGRIWSFRRGRRTPHRAAEDPTPAQAPNRPRAVLVAMFLILLFVLVWTYGALLQCTDCLWRMQSCNAGAIVAWALCSPLALIFLVATIRLLSRLRGRIPKLVWTALATIAAACTAVNLALVSAWVFFGPASLSAMPSRRAGTIVGNIGNVLQDKETAAPQLKKDLHSPNDDVRRRAAILLALIDVADEDVVPELRNALTDTEKEVRHHAALALAHMGAKAKDAIPAMCKALGDQDRDVKLAAAMALQAMGPLAKDAIPEFTKALSDKDGLVRAMAASALSDFGAAAKDAVPDLRKALGDSDSRVRSAVAVALRQMGPVAKDALPELQNALRDPDWLVRSNAAWALGDIGPAAGNAVPDLQELLISDKDSQVRWVAAGSLGKLGPAAKSAVPALRKALTDGDDTLRGVAAVALKKIEHTLP